MSDEREDLQRADRILRDAGVQLARLLDSSEQPERPHLTASAEQLALTLMAVRRQLRESRPPAVDEPWQTRQERQLSLEARAETLELMQRTRDRIHPLLQGELFPDERQMLAQVCGALSVASILSRRTVTG